MDGVAIFVVQTTTEFELLLSPRVVVNKLGNLLNIEIKFRGLSQLSK